MKKLLIISFLILVGGYGFGQKMQFDTINAYHFGGSGMTVQGGDTTFQYNSEIVNSEQYFKYTNSRKPLDGNNNNYGTLYFVNMYNTGDTLLFSTNWLDVEIGRFGDYIRYYPNGQVRTKGQYLFFGDNKEEYLKKGNAGQKTGKWKYYTESGEYDSTEVYDKNVLVLSGKEAIPFDVIVNWKYHGGINIKEKADGKVIKTISNDSLKEDYISGTIYESNKDYFRGKFYFMVTGDTINGWVKKSEHIGAIMKQENVGMTVILYSAPREHNEFMMFEIKNWNPSFVTIESCDGYWAVISLNDNGKKRSGWIRYDKLCPNNYTTCN